MQNPPSLSTSSTFTMPIISGQHGGKIIRCKHEIYPVYEELLKMSMAGNYWAGVTIKGLESLTHGKINNRNIFVRMNRAYTPPGATHKDDFLVMLPGITAVVERIPTDEYIMNYIKLDTAYFERMKDSQEPALFMVSKNNGTWDAKKAKDKNVKTISEKEERLVAVSDGGYKDYSDAATHSARVLSGIHGEKSDRLARNGFDMHYTPHHSSFGGLANYYQATRPLIDSEASPSAIVLAETMKSAKDTKYIQWVSEFGGSTVLTQAMAILVDQDVTLPDHYIFMHRPKSVPRLALKLAHKLELNIGRDFKKSGFADVIGNKGSLAMIYDRKMKEGESYTYGNAIYDSSKSAGSFYGAAKLAIGLTAIPALLTATKAIGTALGVAKATEMGVAAAAPKFHEKIMSKFK